MQDAVESQVKSAKRPLAVAARGRWLLVFFYKVSSNICGMRVRLEFSLFLNTKESLLLHFPNSGSFPNS